MMDRKRQQKKGEAQFTLEQLYISPFSARRQYDEDGNVSWVPIERNLEPTGIWVMDHYLQFLMRGGFYRPTFCEQEGVTQAQLAALVSVLTGMGVIEFQQRYVLMVADELLRYTSLTLDHIAHHYGGIDATNLCRLYKKYYSTTPGRRREHLRQKGDEGRFRV